MVGINSNLAASAATRNLTSANDAVSQSVARLSSGNRIIKASDDVAGLAIGTSISSTLKTLQIAQLNTQQASSVLSIADGALSQVNDILSRQTALATQANAGSLGTTERGYLNQEFQALTSEIDRIVSSTSFNGITLLNGSLGSSGGSDLLVPTASTAAVTSSYGSTGLGNSVLTSLSFNGTFNSAINGSLSGATFTATYNAANNVTYTLKIGNYTYTGTDTDTNTGTSVTLTDASTGSTVSVGIAAQAVANQTVANTLQSGIQTDLRSGTIYQVRTFDTTTTGIPSTNTSGTILDGLDGSDVTIRNSTVSTNKADAVTNINVVAETATTDGSVSLKIGDTTYKTAAGFFTSSNNTDLGTRDLDGAGSQTGVLRIYKDGDATTNPNDFIEIKLTSANVSGIDLDSTGAAQEFADGLNKLFGIGSSGALSFQVGASVNDTIGVSIDSVKTSDIYKDSTGATQTLDITTQDGAQTAIDVLANATQSVISRRADVGAAISRFNFASSNLQVSISNQDSARGSFLDADVATESTNFASAQVKLQASIAVLAQANALPKNLLTLLQ